MELTPEIERLKKEVEIRIGRSLKSPVDFDLLSFKISEKINEHLSATTLKRLWGYIPTDHQPRFSTLSTIARYIGYPDWDSYRICLLRENETESTFLCCKQIRTSDLASGDRIELQWQPDRRCVVRYMGTGTFSVVQAENAKISVGDTFRALSFMLNQPLYVTDLQHGNDTPASYVAGHRSGLTYLSLLK